MDVFHAYVCADALSSRTAPTESSFDHRMPLFAISSKLKLGPLCYTSSTSDDDARQRPSREPDEPELEQAHLEPRRAHLCTLIM